MSGPHLTVGLGQYAALPGEVDVNVGALLGQLEQAGPSGLDLMCFPELCLPGYLLDREQYTGQLRSDLVRAEAAVQAAAEAADVRIVYGTARWDGDRLQDCVVVAEPDGRRTSYAKVHLAAAERAVFSAGDELVLTGDGRIGLGCCYDLAFGGFSTRLADAGARVLCYPMAWECERAFVYEALVAARAVENVAYVVCVNQTGHVGGLDFHGGSRVVDPVGRTVCDLGTDEGVAVVDLDLERVGRLRAAPAGRTFPFAADRRPEQELRGPCVVVEAGRE